MQTSEKVYRNAQLNLRKGNYSKKRLAGSWFVFAFFAFMISVQNSAADDVGAAQADWPSNANPDLPMGGIFYGNHLTGIGVQNSHIAIESSKRFRAERTGTLSTVKFQNRTLRMRDIKSRCASSGPGSVWCNCIDAGLDEYTCGYTLGSSYHVGNGGKIVIEVRTNGEDGKPTNEVLGRTFHFVPMNNPKVPYPTLRFKGPVHVEEGEIYHLVFTNLNPPTTCTMLANISPQEAASCPRDQGAQGLDGPRMVHPPSTTGLRGPYSGDTASAIFFRRTVNSGWSFYSSSTAYYELGYSDGVAVGETYSQLDSMREGRETIHGSTKARQVFTVEDATRNVDGVWLNFGHTSRANGSPMNVTLKDSSGTTLATGSIPASQHCMRTIDSKSGIMPHWCKDWQYTSFGKTINLLEGSKYSVELSAPSGAGFVVSSYFSLRSFGFENRNDWTNSRAQLSRNNGSSWSSWTSYKSDERDMPLLFTIEGMPRKMK